MVCLSTYTIAFQQSTFGRGNDYQSGMPGGKGSVYGPAKPPAPEKK